jgi:hypothetical protein
LPQFGCLSAASRRKRIVFFNSGLQRIAPDSDLHQHSVALGSGKKSVIQTSSPAELHPVA